MTALSNSNDSAITLEEWNGSSTSKLSKTFTIQASSSSVSFKRSGARFTHLWRRLLQALVPEGFPSSVTADYVPFQIWDTLQGLSTYTRTMLSTQALLSAIGVGEKSATVIGATFQWFLRDLTGMLGGILFTFYQGSNLDSNAKMWRLVADLMNDLGMLMDLISPLFPSAFVIIVCLGSISRSFSKFHHFLKLKYRLVYDYVLVVSCRSLTSLFQISTMAAVYKTIARCSHNSSSFYEGSQETVATMIGMALGMLVARITIGHPLAIWVCFLSLTLFHMYANYQAVRCLALTSLNPERTTIHLQHFMKTGQVLSPEQVSAKEHVLPLKLTVWSSKNADLLYTKVHLGTRVSSLDNMEIKEHLLSAASYYAKAKYLLVERNGTVNVIVHKDSNAADVLKSFVHALILAMNVSESKSSHSDSQMWIDKHYDVFIHKLKSLGWKTERLLSPIIWRANWIYKSSEKKVD
ncbi:protein root UVB sensitive 3 [Arachis ipaensis]|uniref:protein root UVB sensitive 3 n=1 Tax=Arachis ipaensis TaxID=130454 RepID=UPI000A2B6B9E|nr:protein root UVB sensitive 3 [Arachis ipaensis]